MRISKEAVSATFTMGAAARHRREAGIIARAKAAELEDLRRSPDMHRLLAKIDELAVDAQNGTVLHAQDRLVQIREIVKIGLGQ